MKAIPGFLSRFSDGRFQAWAAILLFLVGVVLDVGVMLAQSFWLVLLAAAGAAGAVDHHSRDLYLLTQGLTWSARHAVGVLAMAALIAWLTTAYRNVAPLSGRRHYATSWAALGFFVPGLNLVRPWQIARETWRASVAADAVGWERLVVGGWWVGTLAALALDAIAGVPPLPGWPHPPGGVRLLTAAYLPTWLHLASAAVRVMAGLLGAYMIQEVTRGQEERILPDGSVAAADSGEAGKWRHLETVGPNLGADLELHVVAGADKGKVFPLVGSEIVIGRADGNAEPAWGTITVDEPSVSRAHAVLSWNAGRNVYTIQHRSRTNLTVLNGKPINDAVVPLTPGDRLRLGRLEIEVRQRPHTGPVVAGPHLAELIRREREGIRGGATVPDTLRARPETPAPSAERPTESRFIARAPEPSRPDAPPAPYLPGRPIPPAASPLLSSSGAPPGEDPTAEPGLAPVDFGAVPEAPAPLPGRTRRPVRVPLSTSDASSEGGEPPSVLGAPPIPVSKSAAEEAPRFPGGRAVLPPRWPPAETAPNAGRLSARAPLLPPTSASAEAPVSGAVPGLVPPRPVPARSPLPPGPSVPPLDPTSAARPFLVSAGDLEQYAAHPQPAETGLMMEVLSGRSAGQLIPLCHTTVVIGRTPRDREASGPNRVDLDDPYLSRLHGVLLWESSRRAYRLHLHEGSLVTTRVKRTETTGEASYVVTARQPFDLQPGDEIMAGDCHVVLRPAT